MTIITGSEYRANQAKYIERAQEGERVIISSCGGYVELKPVPEEDKDIQEHRKALSFLIHSTERTEDDFLRFNTVEELRAHLASL